MGLRILILNLLLSSSVWAITCPDGSNASGKGCVEFNTPTNVTAHTVCRNVTNSSNNLYFIPLGSLNEWNAFITNSPYGVALANCDCASAVVNWSAGTSCTATIPLGVANEIKSVTANSPNLGSASFKCSATGWTLESSPAPVCDLPPANCVASTVNWTVGGKTCSASAPATNSGTYTGSLTDSSQPTTGASNFLCSNGSYIPQGGSTCVESCPSGTQSWSVGGYSCDATVSLTNNGSYVDITDSSGAETGSARFTCNNGSWTSSGTSCANALETKCLNAGGAYSSPNVCVFAGGNLSSNKVYPSDGAGIVGDSYLFGGTPAGMNASGTRATSILYVSGKLNANYFCKTVMSGSYVTAYSQADANLSNPSWRITYKNQGDSNGQGWAQSNNPSIYYQGADGLYEQTLHGPYSGPTSYPADYGAPKDLTSISCCLDSSCTRLITSSGVNSTTCSGSTHGSATYVQDAMSSDTPSCTVNSPGAYAVRNTDAAAHAGDPYWMGWYYMWGLGNTAGYYDAPLVQDVRRAANKYCQQEFGNTGYAERWIVEWSGEDEAYYAVWNPSYNVFTYDYTGNAGVKNIMTGISCRAEKSANDCVGSWGACSVGCGAGNGTQTYTVTNPQGPGGTACEASNGQTKSCNLGTCPGYFSFPATNTDCDRTAAAQSIYNGVCDGKADGYYPGAIYGSLSCNAGSYELGVTCTNYRVTNAQVSSCFCD